MVSNQNCNQLICTCIILEPHFSKLTEELDEVMEDTLEIVEFNACNVKEWFILHKCLSEIPGVPMPQKTRERGFRNAPKLMDVIFDPILVSKISRVFFLRNALRLTFNGSKSLKFSIFGKILHFKEIFQCRHNINTSSIV